MKLAELEKNEVKKAKALDAALTEARKSRTKLAVLNGKVREALLQENEREAQDLIAEASKEQLRIQALDDNVSILQEKANPYYTDQDVQEGYADYVKTYNAKVAPLKKKYNAAIDEAFNAICEVYELRKTAADVRLEFEKYLLDKDAPLEKLDSIEIDLTGLKSVFRKQCNAKGINVLAVDAKGMTTVLDFIFMLSNKKI